MRVIKVLNTSVVLALDNDGREVVLMGKGIGFHKPIGTILDDSDVEKVFMLKDRSIAKNIIRLSAEIDADIFEIVKEAVDYAQQKYQMRLMEHIYLALTDHLAFAVQRVKTGIQLPELYPFEIRWRNPDEFDIAWHTIALVKEKTDIELPDEEVANIAYHFINAQKEHPKNQNNLQIGRIVNGALDIVKYTFGITYDKESVSYSRFLTHLQAFAQRLILERQTMDEGMDFLYDEVAKTCPDELACAKKISQYVNMKLGKELSGQELLYLTIHIHRILEDHLTHRKGNG